MRPVLVVLVLVTVPAAAAQRGPASWQPLIAFNLRDGKEVWELDYPFPCEFDAEEKRWDFKQPSSWDEVLVRWRARGPRNIEMVAMFQEEFHKFRKTHHKNGS